MLVRSLGIILIPLYTKFFSLAEYGTLAIINVFIQLFSTVFVFGINSAATRFYFREEMDAETRSRMYGTAFMMLSVLPLLAGLLMAPMMGWLASDVYELPFFPFFFVAIAIGVLKPLEKLATGLMRVQKRANHYVMFYVAMFVVQFLVIYWFVAVEQRGLAGQLYGQLIAASLFFVVALITLWPHIQFRFDRAIAKRMLVYGLPLIPYFIFVWFDVAAPRMLLERLGSMEDVGLFALAAQFSGLMLLVGNASDNALLPHYYESASRENASQRIGQLGNKFVGVAALASLVVFVFADDFIRYFADPKFHGAIALIPLLVLASFLRLTYRLVHWNLMHTERTKVVSTMRGLGFALLVALLLLCVGYFQLGVWGVIVSMVATELTLLIAGFWISQQGFRVRYPVRSLMSIIAVVVGSGIVVEVAQRNLTNDLALLVGIAALASAGVMVLKLVEIRVASLPFFSRLVRQ